MSGRNVPDPTGFEEATKGIRKSKAAVCCYKIEGSPDWHHICHAQVKRCIRDGYAPSWFLENIKGIPGYQAWVERLTNPETSPWKAFANYLHQVDDHFKVNSVYFSYNPKMALEFGFGWAYQLSFLVALRDPRENCQHAETVEVLETLAGYDRLKILATLANRWGAPRIRGHDVVYAWTKEAVGNFLRGNLSLNAPSQCQVLQNEYVKWDDRQNEAVGGGFVFPAEGLKPPGAARTSYGLPTYDRHHPDYIKAVYDTLKAVEIPVDDRF